MSIKEGFRRSATVLGFAIVVKGALGYLIHITIAAKFGATASVDAYIIAFSIPSFLCDSLIGYAVISAFIPLFLAKEREHSFSFANITITNILLILSLASLIYLFTSPLWIKAFAPGFSRETYALAIKMAVSLSLALILMGVWNILIGLLNSLYHFTTPAITYIVYSISIIISLLLLSSHLHIFSLPVGITIGSISSLLILTIPLKRSGFRYTPILSLKDPAFKELLVLSLPILLFILTEEGKVVVMRMVASHISDGAIACLNYARLILLIPLSLFSFSVVTATYPTLSSISTSPHLLRETLTKRARLIILFSLPSTIFLMLFAEDVVSLLFERGAFERVAVERTSSLLFYASLSIVGRGVSFLFVKSLFSLNLPKIAFKIGLLCFFLHTILCIMFVRVIGIAGLGLAESISALFFLILLSVVHCRLGTVDIVYILSLLPKICTALLFSTPLSLLLFETLPLSSGVKLGVALLTGVGSFISLGALLQIDEIKQIFRQSPSI
jgi:putative peptidoglycan lipid II flippase